MGTMVIKGKTMRSVDVDWNEFYYTNCPLVSPSNIDQEIGWVKEEFEKMDIAYKFLRSTTENDWYPHYVHNLDNLMRYIGGYHNRAGTLLSGNRTVNQEFTHLSMKLGVFGRDLPPKHTHKTTTAND